VVTGYEDLGVVTDTKMFAGEPSGKFVHGSSYPFKVYTGLTDVTATTFAGAWMSLQYG
jgi:hypothetical protein